MAVAGRTTLTAVELGNAGVSATYTVQDREPNPDVCLSEAPRLLREVGADIGLGIGAY